MNELERLRNALRLIAEGLIKDPQGFAAEVIGEGK